MDAAQINKMLVNLQVRLLKKLRGKVDAHFIDGCVEDFTDEQNGFERGLSTCIQEIHALISEVEKPNTPILPHASSTDLGGRAAYRREDA